MSTSFLQIGMDQPPAAGGSELAIGSSFAAQIGEGSISGAIGRCFDELEAHVDLAKTSSMRLQNSFLLGMWCSLVPL